MKNVRIIDINGRSFEFHKSKQHCVAPITGCRRSEIYEVYQRPSITKVEIWESWCDWCDELNKQGIKCGLEISGANSNCFTISGSLRTDDTTYNLWITRDHNRCFQYTF